MVALAERPCRPCRGGVSPLTPNECASYLAEVPDWELRNKGRTVARRFRFPDYRTQRREHSGGGDLASTGTGVGLGLLRGIVDDQEDRRPARVRDGCQNRYVGARSSRFCLAATPAPIEMGPWKSEAIDRSNLPSAEDHELRVERV